MFFAALEVKACMLWRGDKVSRRSLSPWPWLRHTGCGVECLRKAAEECTLQGGEVAAKLLSLCQGSASVADYSIQFQALAAAGMPPRSGGVKGLRRELKDELAAWDETPDLETLIALITCHYSHLRERISLVVLALTRCCLSRVAFLLTLLHQSPSPRPSAGIDEPVQLAVEQDCPTPRGRYAMH